MICTVSMPGDIVEEPAATGVHELGVALHFHQLERAHAFLRRQRMVLMLDEEVVRRLGAAVEDHPDVGVARRPYVDEQLFAGLVGERNQRVAQFVESRRSGLRQAWFHPGLPPLQPQLERHRSTPCAQLHEVLSLISHSNSGGNWARKLA